MQMPDLESNKRTVVEFHELAFNGKQPEQAVGRGTVAADFFRLEDGKVVEHCDVLHPFPEESTNPHPM
jgi:predicted SnoaL-like aldol condensation-catalyzing enzyme